MLQKLDYQQSLDMITMHAWEIWTHNGNKLDAEDREATEQQVRLAAETTYYRGISDLEWLAATLKELSP